MQTRNFYTIEEVARFLQTSIWSVHRRIKNGELPSFKAGGRSIRVSREALLAFMQKSQIPIHQDLIEKKHKLLIVDDDEKMLYTLRRYFIQKQSYILETASSGFQAGRLIQSFGPDLIILDLMLGDLNGKEVIKTIRLTPELLHIKVIGISGYVKDDEIRALLEIGFDAFWQKPFDLCDLNRTIDSLLKG